MEYRLELGPDGLTDGVIRVRHLVEGDAQSYAVGMSDHAVAPFGRLPRGRYTTDIVRHDIRTRIAYGLRDNRFALLAVADAIEDTFLGSIMLSDLDWTNGTGEVKFWLTPDARGQGVATGALALLCDWCFDELGLRTVIAHTSAVDEASQQVLTRVGFLRADGAESAGGLGGGAVGGGVGAAGTHVRWQRTARPRSTTA